MTTHAPLTTHYDITGNCSPYFVLPQLSSIVQVRHEMIILCNSTLQRDFIIMSEIIKINIVRFAERHSDFSNCVYVTKTFGSDERKHRENACVLKRFP